MEGTHEPIHQVKESQEPWLFNNNLKEWVMEQGTVMLDLWEDPKSMDKDVEV